MKPRELRVYLAEFGLGLLAPIIAPDVFDEVQKLMEEHARRERHEYSVNKFGFTLKGLARCGRCGSALVGYVRPKKNKVHRYYRCIGRNHACPVKCIGADKIEDFVIAKLAALGGDRVLLEKMFRRVETQSKKQIRPMKRERRLIEEQIEQARREAQNLLNMVKAGGESQEATAEIRRLESVRRELEARAAEIDAQVGARQRAVYDVDAIQGALLRFAHFIHKMPNAYQVLVMRILLKQVNILRGKMSVETHELPVGALNMGPTGLAKRLETGPKTPKQSRRSLKMAREQRFVFRGRTGGDGEGEIKPLSFARLFQPPKQINLSRLLKSPGPSAGAGSAMGRRSSMSLRSA